MLAAFIILVLVGVECFDNLNEISTHNNKTRKYSSDYLRLDYIANTKADSSLAHISIGKSKYLDVYGSHYYFFVMNPALDTVSREMLNNGGQWEEPLNLLFKSLVGKESPDHIPSNVRMTQSKNAATHLSHNVIDVGANMGAFTLFAASTGCRVWSFDVQPKLLTLVDMGLRLNNYRHRVKLYNVALHSQEGLEFTFNDDEIKKNNYGGSKILTVDEKIALSKKVNENVQADSLVRVNSKRIDSLFEPKEVFFMKMDCEGCESNALVSMDGLIRNRRVKHVTIEITVAGPLAGPPKQIEIFFLLGYSCRIYDDNSDCTFPNLAPSCYMYSYEDATKLFTSRVPSEKHWKSYMDVHCYIDSGKNKTSISTLRENYSSLDGKHIKLSKDDKYTFLLSVADGVRRAVGNNVTAAEAAEVMGPAVFILFPEEKRRAA